MPLEESSTQTQCRQLIYIAQYHEAFLFCLVHLAKKQGSVFELRTKSTALLQITDIVR